MNEAGAWVSEGQVMTQAVEVSAAAPDVELATDSISGTYYHTRTERWVETWEVHSWGDLFRYYSESVTITAIDGETIHLVFGPGYPFMPTGTYVLKKNGIQPSEVKIDQSIDFGSTAAAFSGGKGAYTVEFEPSATALEQAGDGFVVSSVGVESGYVPYTAFSAKQSYLDNHKDLIQSFTNALQKGMDYVTSHSGKEIADAIKNQFSETDLETLTMIVDRYHEQDTWKDDLVFSQESFDLLLNILEDAEVITKRAPYEKLVTTTFAENAKTK